MGYRHLLMFLGLVLAALGWVEGGWLLVAVWLGCNFLILGVAHGRGWHGLFGKRTDGTLPWWSWVAFFPLFVQTLALWHLIRLLSREPACHVVTERMVVGRRLLASELDGHYEHFVDLTAEFPEPGGVRRSPSYRSFPILDGAAPTPEALRAVVDRLRPGRIYIHCAQGHGRAGLFALAVLLRWGMASSVEEGVRILTAARPGIRLNREQLRCIRAFAQGGTGVSV